MRWLLNILYGGLLVLLLPVFLVAALRTGKYRQGWWQKFAGLVPRRTSQRPCLWLHAVSVGEVQLLGPFLQRFEAAFPAWDCVISTTTRTGFEVASRRYAPRTVFYCPLDFSWAVAAAFRRVRPDALILAELELWPNLIDAAHRAGVPVAIINGRMSDKSYRGYRRLRWLLRRVLRKVHVIAAQDELYAERFRALGAAPDRVHVSGSLKFDGAQTDRHNDLTRSLARLWNVTDDDVVFLAGSTQEPEERVVLEVFQQLAPGFPQLRCVIVPRHPERFDEVARELAGSGCRWERRSQLTADSSSSPRARVLLVDTVGELSGWWGLARIAFVGGSLGRRGGQNMLEPAAYGAAVSFGPNTANFRDIVQRLLAREAACVVRDPQELRAFVERCLTQPPFAAELGQRARQLVLEQQGATAKTVELLAGTLGWTRHDGRQAGPAPAARARRLGLAADVARRAKAD